MLIKKINRAMIDNYKEIYEEHRCELKLNRKTGRELDEYFTNKYKPEILDSCEFRQMISHCILDNEHAREKLLEDSKPQVVSYILDENILVGIDLLTGYFHVESEDLEKTKPLHDDLFVFRGLDEMDLKNYFLVAQYVLLKSKK
ncbi:MAG: hypothetical protein II992_08510 [Lachnospiraceae bacterium]|nr:hypothetical protein [Lachnospiraceae bacterium]